MTLAGVLLAAGEGTRLRPLTLLRPKPLCPVDNVPLLDRAAARVAAVVDLTPQDCAVNAHHLADQVVAWAGDRLHVSVETPQVLGTAGAVANLRPWLDGRDVLIANGDAFFAGAVDLTGFVAEWDRSRPRLLVVEDPRRADFAGRWRFAGISLLPAHLASGLPVEPAGLYEAVWSRCEVDLVATIVEYVDCGTPASYLAANLLASGGRSVISPTAAVLGIVEASVVWPDAVVHRGERLIRCIRARDLDGSDITVVAG
jgi:hypothetical protein